MGNRMERRINPGILILIGLVFLTGCSSTHPAPKMPLAAEAFVPVDGEALPTIGFAGLTLDISQAVAIGYHYKGMQYTKMYDYWWDENFAKRTVELDLESRTLLEEAGYRVSNDDPAGLRLEGILGRLGYNSYERKTSFEQAECEMTWHLYRAGATEPFFTAVTSGAGRVGFKEMGALLKAYELALRRLLTDPEFMSAAAN